MKRMKRDEPVELIVHGSAELQYLPSCGELVLEPSYNVTLSQPQLPHASIENSSNVTDTTYNNTTVSRKKMFTCLPNIGGALCSTLQILADRHY